MDTTLRPMSLGEILDRSIQLLRNNLGLFAGIAVLPELVGLAHSLAQVYRKSFALGMRLPAARQAFLVENSLFIVSLMAGALEIAALCWAASQIVQGQRVSVRQAYGSLRGRIGRMIGVGTLEMLLSIWPIAPAAILAGVAVAAAGRSAGGLLVLVVIVLLLPCAALYPRYALGFPAAAVEGIKARASISRSVELGRGFRWKVLGAAVLPGLIALALFISVTIAFSWVENTSLHAGHVPLLSMSIEQLFLSMARLLIAPFNAIALTLAYYDLRVRKEGLDIERMMEQAGMVVPAPQAESARPAEEFPVAAIGTSAIASPDAVPVTGDGA